MPRWSNNLEQNCKEVMDNVIKNLKPDLYQSLLKEILDLKLENNKKSIENYLRSKLGIKTTLSRHTVGYWKIRGWSDDESYVRSRNHKQKNTKSVYSRSFWTEKINPLTGVNYTIEEADFERNSRRPIRKEYWLKKGYSELESETMAQSVKNQNNQKGAFNNKDSKVRRITSKRCVEYYLARDYSYNEALTAVSNSQRFFSKDICIQKYGEDKGQEIWEQRQRQWRESLKKSGIYLGVSKGSQRLFDAIKEAIPDIEYGIEEAVLHLDKKIISVDCLKRNSNKIIEYFGDYWHANPARFSKDSIVKKKTAEEIWKNDQERINQLINSGYQVLIVWESEVKNNFNQMVEKCVNYLKS